MTELGPFGAAGWPVGFRIRAVLSVIIVPPLVFVMPFSFLAKFLISGFPRYGASPTGACSDEDISTWVDTFLNRLVWPWNRTCLKRAAVIFYLLRSMGKPVVLNVGVRRSDGELKAHAWLTLNSEPYLEPDLRNLGGLKTIATFSA